MAPVFVEIRVLEVSLIVVRVVPCAADGSIARSEVHVLLMAIAAAIAALEVTVHLEVRAFHELCTPDDPTLAQRLVCRTVEVLYIDST